MQSAMQNKKVFIICYYFGFILAANIQTILRASKFWS